MYFFLQNNTFEKIVLMYNSISLTRCYFLDQLFWFLLLCSAYLEFLLHKFSSSRTLYVFFVVSVSITFTISSTKIIIFCYFLSILLSDSFTSTFSESYWSHLDQYLFFFQLTCVITFAYFYISLFWKKLNSHCEICFQICKSTSACCLEFHTSINASTSSSESSMFQKIMFICHIFM